MRRLLCIGLLAWTPTAPALADQVVRPAGKAPLRFRDEVFSRVRVAHGLAFGSAPGRDGRRVKLRLDLYRPRGDRMRRRPVMVWVHGGGFSVGDKARPTMRLLALSTARRGYVTLSVNYRILETSGCWVTVPHCHATALADQHDVQAAIRWVRLRAARYHLDPSRIAVGGESVGGVLAYLVATRAEDPGTSGSAGPSSAVRCFVSISGGFPGGEYASPRAAPGLFFHGTADDIMPHSWSVDAVRALRGAGVPAIFESIRGGGHVRYDKYHRRYDNHTAWYLYRALGLGS
jgi:acetyl esterase/lipase